MTVFYGMAVLLIRILFIYMSYFLLEKVNWRLIFSQKNYTYAQFLCIIVSLSIGHLAGSFVITIIELLQDILLSSFY
ncbi:DUF1146 family protein [Ignavigranum ruoffiae]|uniref:DUF1146 domain-containing protein n=2 Tax=Ignavigranum ruoffiae TaxID=89093 RepID=A0A1H9E1X1_9LACT|nr:DUF1146 family protein [Ignavigranum ruoffiae]SEQ19740.1 Protein of unknown function [Ignavigranum ruoffiae]